MKIEIKVFDSAEELKWYYHKLLCKGDSTALFYMEHVVTEKDVNAWLEKMEQPYRVKET